MRLGIISDVHGNLVALEAVLAGLRRDSPDAIINLGDLATSPLWPRETVDLLQTLHLPTVRGNHDRWIAERADEAPSSSIRFTRAALTAAQRDALGQLPATVSLDNGVLAVHGTPSSDTEYLLEEAVEGRLALARSSRIAERLGTAAATAASLVLCGHSHHQHSALVAGGVLVVNPGSVGCPRYADNDDPHVAEGGSPHARYAVATRRGRTWSVTLEALAYDWDAVAARAIENGRPDFARAFLRT
jgi:predicted phosphodiesterase